MIRTFEDEHTGDALHIRNAASGSGFFVDAKEGHGQTHLYFPAKQAPAIAAAVLEAAGVELTEEDTKYLADFGPENYGYPNDLLQSALYYLRRYEQVREYHAKPRVSDEQVHKIVKAAYDPEKRHGVSDWAARRILQAALDSGVLVPADNKEVDR